ncbi:ABC transporter transmembrane domain-containing protein [Agaribacter flavus]|uniref:ABC transporter transmembrane domain-containing protein n=1 Tax=Agaribacter flavus TaxID=1902781 RepID=A0ABV7FNU5_9ALTE
MALAVSASTWLLLGQGLRHIVDSGFYQNDTDFLNTALLAILSIVFIGSVATFIRFYYMVWLGERVSADIRKTLFDHLLTLSPRFYENERTGEIISRFTSDTTLLQTVIGTSISMALRSSVSFVGAIVLMSITSLKLTLYVFLAIPFILVPVKLLGKKVRHYSKESQNKVANIGSIVDESLHELKTIQAFGAQKRQSVSFQTITDAVMLNASKRIKYRALLISGVMLISMSAIIIVAWLGMLAVIESTLTVGQLIAFMFYAVLAGGAIATVSEVIGEIQKAAGASERILDLLNRQSEIVEDPPVYNAKDKLSMPLENHTHPIISFREIEFAYTDTPVLKGVSFEVYRGQKVALVGESGAGKSTLFDVLLRFYKLQAGSIIINNTRHDNMPLSTLRQHFALVAQDPVIFAGSVAENIAFVGNNEAIDMEHIKHAAKLANAHDFIESLPEGYNSELGERGVKLSGGQKQRIAIARAIAANRPVLLLDEATSALDAKSEREIKTSLDSLMQNKTTIVIAHRLSTVVNADLIVVLDKGRILAKGTHADLYSSNANYKEFVDLQLLS